MTWPLYNSNLKRHVFTLFENGWSHFQNRGLQSDQSFTVQKRIKWFDLIVLRNDFIRMMIISKTVVCNLIKIYSPEENFFFWSNCVGKWFHKDGVLGGNANLEVFNKDFSLGNWKARLTFIASGRCCWIFWTSSTSYTLISTPSSWHLGLGDISFHRLVLVWWLSVAERGGALRLRLDPE